ncbi:MAG: hypothetical protein LBD88_05075 [Candidatus Peribacteria bacterium]|jgi:hypothetical protein|nr:hypothetical protein [Candidatus Peribacteria bacterium]
MAIRAIKNDTPSYTSGTSPNLNKRFKVREIPPGKLAEIMASLREI